MEIEEASQRYGAAQKSNLAFRRELESLLAQNSDLQVKIATAQAQVAQSQQSLDDARNSLKEAVNADL